MHGPCQCQGGTEFINWAGGSCLQPDLWFTMLLKYSLTRQCRQLVHKKFDKHKRDSSLVTRDPVLSPGTPYFCHNSSISFRRIFITSLLRSFNDQGNHQEISALTGPHPCIPNQCLASRTDEIVRPVLQHVSLKKSNHGE